MVEFQYRLALAKACTRLYQPVRATGHGRSSINHFAARWWTRLDVIVYRRFGVSLVVKALGIEDALMLRTRGRRTGQVREVIVAYIEFDGATVVCGANAGWDKSPSWFINIRNGGPIEIERTGHRFEVVPTLLVDEERGLAFAQLCATFPQLCLYGSRTTRAFPIVRLEPRSPHPDLLNGSRVGVGVTERELAFAHPPRIDAHHGATA